MSRAMQAYKITQEHRAKEAALADDVVTIKQKLNEVLKTNEILADENKRKDAALEKIEEAQAARLKAEELAKSHAEKILKLEKLLEEEYAKSKEKDDELIECLEKTSFACNCESQFSGEEGNSYKDGIKTLEL